MKGYSTGDVELLLDLPASTLRFWEKEVALLAPRKDVFGRRLYTYLDICIISRLKHLALDRKFGLKAAKTELERELFVGDQDMKADINALRITLFSLVSRNGELLRKASGVKVEGKDHDICQESL
ncbi:MAG: MerR family transcriptional regulator [Spirochaetes bacterium]|nr:MerR family transcriptional regulator [Spirochaetota bacterium]